MWIAKRPPVLCQVQVEDSGCADGRMARGQAHIQERRCVGRGIEAWRLSGPTPTVPLFSHSHIFSPRGVVARFDYQGGRLRAWVLLGATPLCASVAPPHGQFCRFLGVTDEAFDWGARAPQAAG